jgi:uncharacterized repeat protein (TIGR01451 family)
VAITTAGLGVPGSNPKRLSNEVRYRITYSNLGGAPASFVRAVVPIPEGMTYKPRSTRILQGKEDPIAIAGPKVVNGALYFQIPYLDRNYPANPGAAKTLEFKLQVNKNTPVGTEIKQEGGYVFSRELRSTAAFAFNPLYARVVEPSRMNYTGSRQPANLSTPIKAADRVYHSIFFSNTGGLRATGVEIKYTVPAGLIFEKAIFTTTLKETVGKPISAFPDANRQLTVRVGTVQPTRGGYLRIVLKPDLANAPRQNPANPDQSFMTVSSFQGSDDRTRLAPMGFPEGRTAAAAAVSTLAASTTGAIRQPLLDEQSADLFLMVRGPSVARRGEEVTYVAVWGNRLPRTAGVGSLFFPIPEGMEYVRATATQNIADDNNDNPSYSQKGDPYPDSPETIGWGTSLLGNAIKMATFTLRVRPDAPSQVVLRGGRLVCDQSGVRYNSPLVTTILGAGASMEPITQQQIFAASLGAAADAAFRDAFTPGVSFLSEVKQINFGSTVTSVSGADFLMLSNGAVLVPVGAGRMVAAGAGNIVAAGAGNMVAAGAGNIVAAGAGNAISFEVSGRSRLSGTNVIANAASIVAAGAGNMVAAGAGNLIVKGLVGPDGASLIGMDGASLIGMDGASLGTFGINGAGYSFKPVSGAPFTWGGGSMVAAGAGNLMASSGGLLVDVTGANFVPKTASLIGMDGASMVAAGAGNVVGNAGGNLVGPDGASLVGPDGATLVGPDGASMVAAGAGNLISAGTGFLP